LLEDQIRRAALSVSTNIAEGTGRESEKGGGCFFNVAKGATYEVASLLYIMRTRCSLLDKDQKRLYEDCDEIAKMLTGLLTRS
jgi:four helix bundle protein